MSRPYPRLHKVPLKQFGLLCGRLLSEHPGSGNGTLSVGLFKCEYKIVANESGWDRVWDSVYLNEQHCGNRLGGVQALASMVETHYHNLNAEIINDFCNEEGNNA